MDECSLGYGLKNVCHFDIELYRSLVCSILTVVGFIKKRSGNDSGRNFAQLNIIRDCTDFRSLIDRPQQFHY